MSRRRPKEKPKERAAVPSPTGYLAWSRDPAVSLFAVLPLWLAYEGLRLALAPHERNGAEALMAQSLLALGSRATDLLRFVFACTVLWAAASLHARRIPWLRVGAVIALEGTVYGLMLGPLAAALAASSHRFLAAVPPGSLAADLVASLGAGIFEELVFRLALVSVLSLLLSRVCAGFAVSRLLALLAAVIAGALVFSAFHHVGPGAPPFARDVFVFRAAAGVLLGLLFVARGFGVVVYTHALYDVHYYLTHP